MAVRVPRYEPKDGPPGRLDFFILGLMVGVCLGMALWGFTT